MDGRTPHRFTVADYYQMAAAGIFDENSRVELIRGEIIDIPAVGPPHLGMVNRLNRVFSRLLADRAIISVHNPVRLDDSSEPEPDVVLLKPRADDYDTATPHPADVLLLVEVSDTTLHYDRSVKAPLYAESGITEYWIVNLVDHVIEVYCQPEQGRYAQVERIGADRVMDFVTLPGITLPAAHLLRTPA